MYNFKYKQCLKKKLKNQKWNVERKRREKKGVFSCKFPLFHLERYPKCEGMLIMEGDYMSEKTNIS